MGCWLVESPRSQRHHRRGISVSSSLGPAASFLLLARSNPEVEKSIPIQLSLFLGQPWGAAGECCLLRKNSTTAGTREMPTIAMMTR